MNNENRLIKILKHLKHKETENAPPDKIGISPAQVNIIDEVSLAGELTVKELAERLNLTPPTISVGVKKLEKISLLKRKTDKDDGRRVLLMLSKEGNLINNQIIKFRNTRVRTILSKLSPQEQNTMLLLLEKALINN